MLIFTLDGEVLVLIVGSDFSLPRAVRTTAASVLIGSDAGCDLVIPEAAPQHARIDRVADEVYLTDLDSPGGTYVNEQRIYRTKLNTGDQIRFARARATPAPAPTPAPPATPPPSAARTTAAMPAPSSANAPGATRPPAAPSPPLPPPQRTFAVAPIPQVAAGMTGAQGLLHLSVALGRPGSLEAKLDEILEYSLQLGSFDRAAIWVHDPDQTGEFLHHRQRQAPGRPPAEVSQTILKQVLRGEALIIGDAALDARVEKALSVQMQNVRTCVALPLRTTERIWGVLYLDCLHPRPLADDTQQEFLVGFAALAAVAIANSWLSAKAQRESILKDRLTRFFPPNAMEKILAQAQGPLAGAELSVTILFCDIRNYTGISFEQPPRRVAAWLNDYFSRIVPLVFANGGTLEKYIGDAMLAIWGAPLEMSPAEQALHSCRAAVQIQRAAVDFSRAWPDLPCYVGIGIHHGPAYVGTIGHESYLQYAAFGSTTNLAARLCSAAGPGETILSRYLADHLPPSQFRTVARPAVAAKGFPEVIEVCALEPVVTAHGLRP